MTKIQRFNQIVHHGNVLQTKLCRFDLIFGSHILKVGQALIRQIIFMLVFHYKLQPLRYYMPLLLSLQTF